MANTKNTEKVKKVKPAHEAELPKSIRVKSKSEYEIEVNDKGETIVFDLSDVSLPDKLIAMTDKIDALVIKMQAEAEAIASREDFQYNDHVTQNQKDTATIISSFYAEARIAADEFMGEGACQKIFGSKNYFEMYNDLVELLEPHFKKMGITSASTKARAKAAAASMMGA